MVLMSLTWAKQSRFKMFQTRKAEFSHTGCLSVLVCFLGQIEIERACDLLFKKAESIDYQYEVHDRSVEGLLILPLYGSMTTGKSTECHTGLAPHKC